MAYSVCRWSRQKGKAWSLYDNSTKQDEADVCIPHPQIMRLRVFRNIIALSRHLETKTVNIFTTSDWRYSYRPSTVSPIRGILRSILVTRDCCCLIQVPPSRNTSERILLSDTPHMPTWANHADCTWVSNRRTTNAFWFWGVNIWARSVVDHRCAYHTASVTARTIVWLMHCESISGGLKFVTLLIR